MNLAGSFRCECNSPAFIRTAIGCVDNDECITNQVPIFYYLLLHFSVLMDTLCNLTYTLLCFREEKSDFADRNEANTELLLIEGMRMIFHKKRTVKSGIFQKYR